MQMCRSLGRPAERDFYRNGQEVEDGLDLVALSDDSTAGRIWEKSWAIRHWLTIHLVQAPSLILPSNRLTRRAVCHTMFALMIHYCKEPLPLPCALPPQPASLSWHLIVLAKFLVMRLRSRPSIQLPDRLRLLTLGPDGCRAIPLTKQSPST
jgi:hypothetical protein